MTAQRPPELIMGVSCMHHDAAVAVVRGREVLFASHSERYSRIKNDPNLCASLIRAAMAESGAPDRIVFYERPWRTRLRQFVSGQSRGISGLGRISAVFDELPELARVPVSCVAHHLSHAAGGYFTSPFDEAAIVVADAIGEWDTLSVWHARQNRLRRVFRLRYPHSLGLFYSSFTQRVGLKPNEEEFILMALAAMGRPALVDVIRSDFIRSSRAPSFKLKQSLDRGVREWRPEITSRTDIAASVQHITEQFLRELMVWVHEHVPSRNLVYSGGLALNCIANSMIAKLGLFDRIWIMPNPGDAGSSLGAALAYKNDFVDWKGPYLGHDIGRLFDADGAASALAAGEIIGVATGRAEFGPRALGNRSLLADPRGKTTKDRVNDIKCREPFRPFAPVVLQHRAQEFFEMTPSCTPYMQYGVRCRRPDLLPAICHVDGTSRTQTVSPEQNPALAELLQRFEAKTGCPVLLNTSLNVRGQPIVNTWEDAKEFSHSSNVRVF